MQAAILGGALDRPLGHPYHCKTGNCTWPELTTLGVCSTCADITSQVNESCTPYSSVSGGDKNSRTSICTMTAPSGLEVWQSIDLHKDPEKHEPSWTQFVSVTNSSNQVLEQIYNKIPSKMPKVWDYQATGRGNISHHLFLADLGHYDNHEKTFRPSRQYTECTFYWCSRSHSNFRISNGRTEAGVMTSAPLRVEESHLISLERGTRSKIKLTAPQTSSPEGTVFSASLVDMASICDLMDHVFTVRLFNGHNLAAGANTHLQLDYSLFKSANLSRTMEDVAESMTNAIRQCGDATEVHGQAFRDETYMRVRWAWFALPASLVFLTAAILIAAVRINSRNKVMLWKSSMLPLLFHGLDTTVDAPPRQKLSQVDARARVARAKLHVTDSNDLRFVLS